MVPWLKGAAWNDPVEDDHEERFDMDRGCWMRGQSEHAGAEVAGGRASTRVLPRRQYAGRFSPTQSIESFGAIASVLAMLATGGHAWSQDPYVSMWGENGFQQAVVPAAVGPIVAVDGGVIHTVLLEANGAVRVLGNNQAGQAILPPALPALTAIAAGGFHTLGLDESGSVWAWGSNHYGQTNVPAGLGGVTAIAAGGDHSMALRSDGTLVCWGRNSQGQLTVPPELGNVVRIAAGGAHSLAVDADGGVYAWGSNQFGQVTVPPGLEGVSAVAAGEFHSVALRTNGSVVCWGRNNAGQCNVPADLLPVVAIRAGASYTMAQQVNGQIRIWGSNAYGQVGVVEASPVTAIGAGWYVSGGIDALGQVHLFGRNDFLQARVPGALGPVTAVSVGPRHSVGLTASREVRAWGDNRFGQSEQFDDLRDVVMVAAGFDHSMALRDDGTVFCWGANGHGQCDVPAEIQGLVVTIAAGDRFSLAGLEDGSIRCWGLNNQGQCQSIPTLGLGEVVELSAGTRHSMALLADGTVRAWGANGWGQCDVPADLAAVSAVSAGEDFSVALLVDGSVRCWGRNDLGQCVVPGDLGPVVSVSAGVAHTLALRGDGDVRCWGVSDSGQCSGAVTIDRAFSVVAGGNVGSVVGNPGCNGPVSTPRALIPVRSAVGVRPVFQWVAPSCATFFRVRVSRQVDGSWEPVLLQWIDREALAIVDGVASWVLTGASLAAGVEYRWDVQGWKFNTGTGPWSPARAFDVQVASQLSPLGEWAESKPTYRWQSVPGATWYRLWVMNSDGQVFSRWYAAAAVATGDPDRLAATPDFTLSQGEARWWVQAWEDEQGVGPWTPAATVSISPPGRPELISPLGTLTGLPPVFEWTEIRGVPWYRIWVEDPNGVVFTTWYTASELGCDSGICSVSPILAPISGSWRWWVRPWTAGSLNGPWSLMGSFAVPTF
jgi:alpha-tubulin suppressor-like RCC1 family protein